jgi:hypothetical protein
VRPERLGKLKKKPFASSGLEADLWGGGGGGPAVAGVVDELRYKPRKVADSRPNEVNEFFQLTQSFQPH